MLRRSGRLRRLWVARMSRSRSRLKCPNAATVCRLLSHRLEFDSGLGYLTEPCNPTELRCLTGSCCLTDPCYRLGSGYLTGSRCQIGLCRRLPIHRFLGGQPLCRQHHHHRCRHRCRHRYRYRSRCCTCRSARADCRLHKRLGVPQVEHAARGSPRYRWGLVLQTFCAAASVGSWSLAAHCLFRLRLPFA